MTGVFSTESKLIVADNVITLSMLEKLFVDVPLKRFGYYREKRDGSVAVGFR